MERGTKKILDALTLDEMFEKFMTFKKTEALSTKDNIKSTIYTLNTLKDTSRRGSDQ